MRKANITTNTSSAAGFFSGTEIRIQASKAHCISRWYNNVWCNRVDPQRVKA